MKRTNTRSTALHTTLAACALLALSGCGTTYSDHFSSTEGGITGAGAGALAGAALSGGLLVPVLAAAGGAVAGSELAEPDPAPATASSSGTSYDDTSSSAATTTQPSDLFSRLDDDHNGSLDRNETLDSEDVDRNWTRLDSNEDGRIERSEFTKQYSTLQPGR